MKELASKSSLKVITLLACFALTVVGCGDDKKGGTDAGPDAGPVETGGKGGTGGKGTGGKGGAGMSATGGKGGAGGSATGGKGGAGGSATGGKGGTGGKGTGGAPICDDGGTCDVDAGN